MEVVEGVAGEEDRHDDQEEQGEENVEAEGQHDEHDEDGKGLREAAGLRGDTPIPIQTEAPTLLSCIRRQRHGAGLISSRRDRERQRE